MSPRAFAMLFFALVGLCLPSSNADASPFVITLLGSAGSGGHSDDGNVSVDDRPGSNAVSVSDADRLGLSVHDRRTTGMWPTFGFPGGALSLIPAIKRALAAADVFGPTAFLDLGDGEYLAVSSDVAESLAGGVPADASLSAGQGGSGQPATVQPSQAQTQTVANNVTGGGNNGGSGIRLGPVNPAGGLPLGSNGASANDMIGGVLADVSSGLVFSPPGVGSSLVQASANGLAPAADAPAHSPEPATLILLASALAITARRLRRPRI